MYELYIANKNYSSWSLRPWVLMRTLRIPFIERLIRFGDVTGWADYRRVSPTGKVPCLVDGPIAVWDSLAVAEYLAERHPGVWPTDPAGRAWARCAAAEMHSGFSELRNRCSMTCGVRVKLNEFPPVLKAEIGRLNALWNGGLTRFGGPFLAGSEFTAVDAFFAPVAFRVRSYGLVLESQAADYARGLLDLPAMEEWYAAALQETFRDEPHEMDMRSNGEVLEDARAT